jgi:hypothetical protein
MGEEHNKIEYRQLPLRTEINNLSKKASELVVSG